MSSQSQYLGSQAFNQLITADEFVVPNTGTLSVTKTLASLRGIAAGVNLNLGLSYSAGTAGLLGLPANWTFGISYLVPGESLTTQGKTYVIDPTWSDVTGYQSGLRYMNNHGIKFQAAGSPQKLPSGQPGSYSFTLTYNDGARDFYDETGKLVEHDDLFGNHINYFYTDQFSGVFSSRLDHLIDSFGQTVRFGYGPGSIVITTPDGGQATISFSEQGVLTVQDPLGNVTAFTYTAVAGQTVVETIVYPTGLKTQLNYIVLHGGGQAAFPAVSDHIHLDAGSVLDHTSYAFGTDSGGNNFTGGFVMSSTADNLMDSNDTAYLYDVLVTKLDAGGEKLAASRVYFNYLHLPMREEHYLIDSSSPGGNGYRALYSYQIDPDSHARATSYAQPILTQQLVFSTTAGDYVPLRQATAAYDSFGCLLESEESLFDPAAQSWVSQMKTANTYVAAAWGGEMPQSAVYIDNVSGFQRQIAYTLTADKKCIETAAVLFSVDAQSHWSPWKTKSYTYDSSGRVTSTTLAWSPGGNPPPTGSATSTTTTNAYSFDAPTRTYTTTSTDALGHTTTRRYDVGVATGPMTQFITPLGATTIYRYDALGRATLVTDAEGFSTATVYTLSAGSNSAVTTGPTGYVVASCFDAMGREIKTMDNGDPTQPAGPAPTRTLRQTVYDPLGNVAQVTDGLGLITSYSYDSLNRRVRSTDPLGNVGTITHDDGAGTASYSMNGTLRQVTQFDGLGRVVTVTDFADPGDASITYELLHQISYDGFGQTIGTRLSSVPLSGGSPQPLYQGTFAYDAEAKILSELYVGSNGAQVTLSRATTYDLFGNPVVYQKQTTYADGRSFQATGSTSAFDAAGQLVSITNQLGQVERYTYDADGDLQTLTRFDGTVFSYNYNKIGELLQMAWTGGSITYTYLPNGLVQTKTSGDATLQYTYSLDGTVQSVTYPDGHTQKYGLDAVSRVVSQTDPSGAVTTTAFDSLGRVAQRLHGGDSVTYTYGTVNHVAGVLIGDSLSGVAPSARQLSYDGFGRASATLTTDAGGRVMLRAGYTRDAVGRLTGLALTSATSNDPGVNLSRQLTYDGINQLVGSSSTYSGGPPPSTVTYTYDGNFNIVGKMDNGTTQTFTYNAIDQLNTPGAAYDANGRMTADGLDGRSYTYDELDRLTQVAANDGTPLITYTYHPDGTLATTTVARNVLTFYYNSGDVNAIAALASLGGNPTWTTFLFDAGGRHAAYAAGQPPSYYFLGTDSTSLLQQDGGAAVALDYDAYGAMIDGAQIAGNESFAWTQEYTDPVSGLIYLRARYYNPGLMRFMTMDNLTKDNRYAYCAGDPINRVDPTGHMEVSEIVGLVVGTAVSIGAFALVGPAAVPIAAQIFGSESIAVSAGASVVAGAASSIAGDAATATISGQRFTAQRALIDLASGAIGGGVGSVVSDVVGHMARAMISSQSEAVISTIRAVSAAGGGISGSAVAGIVTSLASGQPFFSSNTALSLSLGALTGSVGDFLISGAYLKIRSAGFRTERITLPPSPDEGVVAKGSDSSFVGQNAGGRTESVKFSISQLSMSNRSLPDQARLDFLFGGQGARRARSLPDLHASDLSGHGMDNAERRSAIGFVSQINNLSFYRRRASL